MSHIRNKVFQLNKKPRKGMLLLAEPFMHDSNFKRTVILLTEFNLKEGTVGFIINRPLDIYLDQIMPEIVIPHIPIFSGGPVHADSLHYIHSAPDIITESTKIINDVYWGGNFNQVVDAVNSGKLSSEEIKFFVGYSGWDANQIEEEIEENTWFVTKAKKEDIYSEDNDDLWKTILNELGGEFKQIANYPENPIWN